MHKLFVSCRQRSAVLCLALAVFNLHSSTVLATNEGLPLQPSGDLTLAGVVHVDDAPAIPGQTIFPGSTFRVAAASHSTLTLGNHGRLELSAETILKLDFSDDQVTGALRAGRLRVASPAGVAARLMTEDAALLADSRQPAIFSVERERDGGTNLSVEAGMVEMSVGDRTQLVSAGQRFSTRVGSSTVPNERRHLGSFKRNVLEFGLVGVFSIITLVLAGNGGGNVEDVNFGGTVCGLSPFAGDPCGSIP